MDDSNFPFTRPSFLGGIARLFDTSRSLDQHNTSLTPAEADTQALNQDMLAVARDFEDVLGKQTPAHIK